MSEINQEVDGDAEQVAAGEAISQAMHDLKIGGEQAHLVTVGTVYTGPVTVHIHITVKDCGRKP